MAIAIAALMMTHFLRNKSEFDTSHPAISGKSEANFRLQMPDATLTVINGNISIFHAGDSAAGATLFRTTQGKRGVFYVNRTLLMDWLYHPENHVVALTYIGAHVSTLDTVPDEMFYRARVRSNTLLMRVDEVGDNLLLFSSPESPQFMYTTQSISKRPMG